MQDAIQEVMHDPDYDGCDIPCRLYSTSDDQLAWATILEVSNEYPFDLPKMRQEFKDIQEKAKQLELKKKELKELDRLQKKYA